MNLHLYQLTNFAKLDFSRALNRAYKKQLTFYDASHIATAETTEAILVTDDEKLRKTASKLVKTITYTELETRLTQR